MSAPDLICYQHCRKGENLFSFTFPEVCKICRANLMVTGYHIPPFRVVAPFQNAATKPNSIVIKPAHGNFLNDYRKSDSLHVGVTDSSGNVFEYDANGVTTKGKNWTQCIIVEMLDSPTEEQKLYWNNVLNTVTNKECWAADKYEEDQHNCYSFVLDFLRSLQFRPLMPYIKDKTRFCQYFMLPQTQYAAKYISVYRQLVQELEQ